MILCSQGPQHISLTKQMVVALFHRLAASAPSIAHEPDASASSSTTPPPPGISISMLLESGASLHMAPNYTCLTYLSPDTPLRVQDRCTRLL